MGRGAAEGRGRVVAVICEGEDGRSEVVGGGADGISWMVVVVGRAKGEAENGRREAVVVSPVGAKAEGDVAVGLGSDAEVWPGVLERWPRPSLFFLVAMRERERDASSFARRPMGKNPK